MMRICPPMLPASFGENPAPSPGPRRHGQSAACRCFRALFGAIAIKSSAGMFAYHTASGSILENPRMCSR